MWELLKAIVVVTVSLAVLLGFLGLLYWLTSFLPRRWQESWRAWVFLLPAMIAMLVGLLIPAIRTIYLSLLDDDGKNSVGFDNYLDIFQTHRHPADRVQQHRVGDVGTLDHGRHRPRRRSLRRRHQG